jgi:hypothetical protein
LGLGLTAAVLLVGTTASSSEIAKSPSSHIDNDGWRISLHVLHNSLHWEQAGAAIVRLNEFLEINKYPIDYARRRELDYSTLLPERLGKKYVQTMR